MRRGLRRPLRGARWLPRRPAVAVPALFVAVEAERLRELGIALRELPREGVRLGEPRLLGAVRRIEELERRAPFAVAAELDGLAEVEHVVRAAVRSASQRGKPPGSGAIGGARHQGLAMAAM